MCCGMIFVGKQGEVLVDPRFFVPCSCRVSGNKKNLQDLNSTAIVSSVISCSTSDGGSHYGDELSEHNLSDDSLDARLDDSCYSSAANSPLHDEHGHPPLLLHLSSDHNSQLRWNLDYIIRT